MSKSNSCMWASMSRTEMCQKIMLLHGLRMFGTFNQHLPMILSNSYWCQSKPTSLPDTGMGAQSQQTDVSCNM